MFINQIVLEKERLGASPRPYRKDEIKSGKLTSGELRKIYINLMADKKRQTKDSKTSLGFKENVVSEIVTAKLLNTVSTLLVHC